MPTCRSCNADAPAGQRWCGICHANVINPSLGRLASPGKRLGAYVLDVLVPLVAFFFILIAGGAAAQTGGGPGFGMLVAFGLLIAYTIWAIRDFMHGTTPGKQMLGMHVIKEHGQRAGFGTMVVRELIGKTISGLLLSLGFLWILFDRDRQGWHDKLVSTYVVE